MKIEDDGHDGLIMNDGPFQPWEADARVMNQPPEGRERAG